MQTMKGLKQLILIFAAFSAYVFGTYTYIAGYEPQSDVVQHSRIDLDVQQIIGALPTVVGGVLSDCPGDNCVWSFSDLKEAHDIWTKGKNSAKSTSNRSIAAFSSGAETKSSGNGVDTDVDYKDNSHISVMNNYWNSKGLNMFTWGFEIINASFNGDMIADIIDMGEVGDYFRKEAIQKGIIYLNVYPYVIWEMQDAINDCNTGDIEQNDNSVHAWDEAVAFYTGSLEGVSQGGNNGLDSCEDGNCVLQFYLADKRCTNFGTCTADYDMDDFAGYSKVNSDLFKLFTQGRDQILGAAHTAECPDTNDLMDEISTRMLIPFIQGVQRYLYKTSVPATPSSKEAGELFAFASAVLPFIHQANPETAEMLFNRAWKLDYDSVDWKDIKYAIEETYPLLGVGAGVGTITCLQVGQLKESGVVLSEACVDPSTSEEDTGVPRWAIGLIVVLAILLIATALYAIFIRQKYSKALPLLSKTEGDGDVQMTS